MIAPICPTCRTAARLTTGAEVYPNWPRLADKAIWKCAVCPDAHVGCHPGSTCALGRPADKATREARLSLHRWRIDPLWMHADQCAAYRTAPMSGNARRNIRQVARTRVYDYLAECMGLTSEQTHTGLFTAEQCRVASELLAGVTYSEIRDWARARRTSPPLHEARA